MHDQIRWTVMLICVAACTVVGIAQTNGVLIVCGIIATLGCLAGMVIDYFRDRDTRTLREEVAAHRRAEAFHRRANQRRNP